MLKIEEFFCFFKMKVDFLAHRKMKTLIQHPTHDISYVFELSFDLTILQKTTQKCKSTITF